MKFIDLTNQRFGRLVAMKPTKERKDGRIVWHCVCDCGNEHFVTSAVLLNGFSHSCGCLQKELLVKRLTKHGMHGTPAYNAWRSMKTRCKNPNDKGYCNYGGRGISVSEEFHDFQIWYEHIGPHPGLGYSQDRIENNGNYERGNIQWSTRTQQNNNKCPNSCNSKKPQRWFYAYGPNGEMVIDNTQNNIAKVFGLDQANISACLRNKRKSYRNWHFKLIN